MSKPTLLAILGTILLAAAILLNSLIDWDRTSDTVANQRPVAAPPSAPAVSPSLPSSDPAPAPDAASAARNPAAPSFDVVRINPEGDAVLAGRAAPGAEVTVRDGETVIGRVQADDRGEWVLVPDKPLPPGSRVFNLSSQVSGGEAIASESELVLVVPNRDGGSGQGALALRVPHGTDTDSGADLGQPSVLQSPFSSESSRGLAIGIIEYDETGKAAVSGSAQPGARLRITLDGTPGGTVEADTRGEWRLALPAPIAPGEHRLRVEQLTADGTVGDQADYDFARQPAAEGAAPTAAVIVVESGNSLWRIARRTYGRGIRYTLIVEANRQHIRNPDLIYPGQVFELPPNR